MGVRIAESSRTGLEDLDHGDLAAFGCDPRVETHVLALERGHEVSHPVEYTAEGGDRYGFPGIGSRTEDHERLPLVPEPPLRLGEDLREEPRIPGLETQLLDLIEGELHHLRAVAEETVLTGPYGFPMAGYDIVSHRRIPARIERTVAEGAVLAVEVAGVVVTAPVTAYVPFPYLLLDLLPDTIRGLSSCLMYERIGDIKLDTLFSIYSAPCMPQ